MRREADVMENNPQKYIISVLCFFAAAIVIAILVAKFLL